MEAVDATTVGEFKRAMIAAGESDLLEQWLAEHFEDNQEPEELDDRRMDKGSIPGYADGDFPPMAQQVMLYELPENIAHTHGEVVQTVLNGPRLELTLAEAFEVEEALKALGYSCERDDVLICGAFRHADQ